MRGTLLAGRVGRRRSPGGRRARHRDRWRQRHLREAAQGRVRRRHPVPPGARSTCSGSSKAATGWRARRATSCRRTTSSCNAKLAGYKTSRQDFTYDLYVLADWKKPILDVKRGKSYIPGIGGSQFGGDFGSMVNSPSGDVTGPVWAADLAAAVSGGEHVDLGLRGGGLRGDAQGRDRADPARHLRRADQVAERADRRARARSSTSTRARRRARARGAALVRHGGAGRDDPDRRPRRSRPSPTSRAASARAWSAKPHASGSNGARTRPSRPRTSSPRPAAATRTRSSSSARTSTASAPARASTTTAPARRRCSSSRRSCAA